MDKFLSGLILSGTIFVANMAPVLANPTNIKTGNSATVNSVVPKSNLVEIEGRILTDAEASGVEGEKFWLPVGGAVAGFGFNTWRNVANGRPWHDQWASSTAAGAFGATCGGIAVASKGAAFRVPNSGSFWSACGTSANHLRGRW